MSLSLRDQLAQLGFKPAPVEKSAPARQLSGGRPGGPGAQGRGGKPAGARDAGPPKDARKPGRKPPRSSEMDLGKAYALRAQREKEERIAAEQRRQEEARERREARAALARFLQDKALNLPEADIARHFDYGGKIKRVHVTAEQLRALNAGELGVVQNEGRYVLVTAAVLEEAAAIFAPAVALRVDPNATAEEDPYADPLYRVPDDLVW